MKRRGLAWIAVAGVLILGWHAQALGGDRDGPEGPVGTRLVYVFSPRRAVEWARARALPGWMDRAGWRVGLVGVLRPEPEGGGGDRPPPDPVFLDYPVLSPDQARAAGVPVGVLEGRGTRDVALLMDARRVLWQVEGEWLERRLRDVARPTDIDDSTWGKIKELFR